LFQPSSVCSDNYALCLITVVAKKRTFGKKATGVATANVINEQKGIVISVSGTKATM
jgi:hypothetical protein